MEGATITHTHECARTHSHKCSPRDRQCESSRLKWLTKQHFRIWTFWWHAVYFKVESRTALCVCVCSYSWVRSKICHFLSGCAGNMLMTQSIQRINPVCLQTVLCSRSDFNMLYTLQANVTWFQESKPPCVEHGVLTVVIEPKTILASAGVQCGSSREVTLDHCCSCCWHHLKRHDLFRRNFWCNDSSPSNNIETFNSSTVLQFNHTRRIHGFFTTVLDGILH